MARKGKCVVFFQELHISNMLQRFISVDSVMPVRAVKLSGCPYLMVYPFMNVGSYLDFAQQMGSRLSIAYKVEVSSLFLRILCPETLNDFSALNFFGM